MNMTCIIPGHKRKHLRRKGWAVRIQTTIYGTRIYNQDELNIQKCVKGLLKLFVSYYVLSKNWSQKVMIYLLNNTLNNNATGKYCWVYCRKMYKMRDQN